MWYVRSVLLCVFAAGCAAQRPVHPLALDGFPGAPIEPGLFPLRPARALFRGADGGEMRLEMRRDGEGYLLTGVTEAAAQVRRREGFIEIVHDGKLVARFLKLEGAVGDRWRGAGARYTAFGYDDLEILGETRRALVVAADRGAQRDLFWFAPDLGLVRLRTEKSGRAERDVRLVEYASN